MLLADRRKNISSRDTLLVKRAEICECFPYCFIGIDRSYAEERSRAAHHRDRFAAIHATDICFRILAQFLEPDEAFVFHIDKITLR